MSDPWRTLEDTGDLVRQLRRSMGLTQKELGTRMGYKAPQQSIYEFEHRWDGMQTSSLVRLGEAMGVEFFIAARVKDVD